jgi:ERCC4-type nuclease
MNRNRRGGGGGSTTTLTTNSGKIKALKARNAANQEAMDRLTNLAEQQASHYRTTNSNFILTLQRAMKSLQSCEHAITTVQEAMDLKYVGERLARVIVPNPPRGATAPRTVPVRARTISQAATSTTTTTTTINRTNRTALKSVPSVVARTASSAKEQAYLKAKHHAEQLCLPTGPWKVILLVDVREHRSQMVVAKCQQSGIPCEERSLPIGDMAWIAQCGDLEVLVGTILERKQVDDLAGSIYGTRFQEQRLRLCHCGLPQILYLVEGDLTSVANCPAETLRMAMMETRVQLGFGIIHTKHLDHTVQTLKGLHRRIIQRTFPDKLNELPTFAGRDSGGDGGKSGRNKNQRRPSSLLEMVFDEPPVPPFGEQRFMTYPELKTKIERDREAGTRTVGAIFGAMLKQVTSLSQKKCEGIASIYPTMNRLMEAYEKITEASIASSTTATLEKPNLPLLVKDVSTGTQRVGPKSASELDVVCCMNADGTLRSLKSGAVVQHPEPGTLLRPETVSRTVAAARQPASTTAVSRSVVASATVTGNVRTSAATTVMPPVGVVPYEPAWCNNSSDSDDPGESIPRGGGPPRPDRLEVLLLSDEDTPMKIPASSKSLNKRPLPNSQLSSEWSSDDDSSCLDAVPSKKARAHPPALPPLEVSARTSFDTLLQNENGATNGGKEQLVACARTNSTEATRHSRPREFLSDSSALFSSPSTTASGCFQLSQDSPTTLAFATKKKKKKTTKETADTSIVEIDDSSDDEDRVQVAVGAAAPVMAREASPEDLRTRLAKRMGRETIVID